MAGCGENGNEHSGFVKCGELCDWMRNGQLLKNDSSPWSWLVKQNAVVIVKHLSMEICGLCLYLFGYCPSSSFLFTFS